MRNSQQPNKAKRLTTTNCLLGTLATILVFFTVGLYMVNNSRDAEVTAEFVRKSSSSSSPSSVLVSALLGGAKDNQGGDTTADKKNNQPISASVLQQRLSGLLKSNDFDLLKQQLRAIRTGDVGRVYSMKDGGKPVTGGAGLSGPIKESPLVEEADELLAESSLVGAPWTRLKFHRSVDRSRTIFVAIANANSNQQCSGLVDSIFTNAKYPYQIRVGLVESIEDVKSIAKREPTTDTGVSTTALEMRIKSEVAALDEEFNRHLNAVGGDTDESRKKFSDANLPSKIHPADRDLLFHRSSCVHPKYALCNQSKFCPTDYIRVRKIPRSEMLEKGRGVSWMKHLSTMMYRSEQYILVLDAASGSMAKDWDATLVDQYVALQTKTNTAVKTLTALSGRLPTATSAEFGAVAFDVPAGAASSISTCSSPDEAASALATKGLPTVATASKGSLAAATTEFLFTEGAAFLTRVPLDPFALDVPAALYDLVLSARLTAAGYTVTVPTSAASVVQPSSSTGAAVYELDKTLSLFGAEETTDIAPAAVCRTTATAFLESVARQVSILTHPTESGIFESEAPGSSDTVKSVPTPKSVLSQLIGADGASGLTSLATRFKEVCTTGADSATLVHPVKDVRYTIGGYHALRHRILNEHKRLAHEDIKKSTTQ